MKRKMTSDSLQYYWYMKDGIKMLRHYTDIKWPRLIFRDGMSRGFGSFMHETGLIQVGYRTHLRDMVLCVYHEMVHWWFHVVGCGWVCWEIDYRFDKWDSKLRYFLNINTKW